MREFWGPDWVRHGTCSGMDQHAYFRAGLDLKARVNLTGAQLDAGIVPSDEAWYCLRGVLVALGAAAPMVECNLSARNETQLYQVYVCVGRDGRTLVECPSPAQRGCTDMVRFPPFSRGDAFASFVTAGWSCSNFFFLSTGWSCSNKHPGSESPSPNVLGPQSPRQQTGDSREEQASKGLLTFSGLRPGG